MQRLKYLTVFIMAMSLAACEQGRQNRQPGTLIGAGSGAPVGAPVGGESAAAAVGGILAGTWIGHEIEPPLNHEDEAVMQKSTQHALSVGRAGKKSTWQNPANGHSGSVTPQIVYHNKEGRKCREYQQTLSIKGKIATSYGTACLEGDGTWRVASRR